MGIETEVGLRSVELYLQELERFFVQSETGNLFTVICYQYFEATDNAISPSIANRKHYQTLTGRMLATDDGLNFQYLVIARERVVRLKLRRI